MSSANINIRTDAEIKEQAEVIFEALGLTMSTAINMFLRQSIRERGIPFDLKLPEPNDITLESINEGRDIANNKAIKGYTNMKDLKDALDI